MDTSYADEGVIYTVVLNLKASLQYFFVMLGVVMMNVLRQVVLMLSVLLRVSLS